MLIAEFFSPNQLLNNRPSGGPKDLAMLYDTDLLQTDFISLSFLKAEEKTSEMSEGLYHKGLADIVQFVAIKT